MKANHLLALAILAICLQYGAAVDRKSWLLLPTANNGQACNATSEAAICGVTGTICGYYNECPKCVCDASVYDIVVTKADTTEMCTNKAKIDGACTENGECPTHATCSSQKCACTAPKIATTDKTACVDPPKKTIGTACSAAECGTHAECNSGSCACKTGAVVTSNNIDCEGVTGTDTVCDKTIDCTGKFYCKADAADQPPGKCTACPATCATCDQNNNLAQTKCATCASGEYLDDAETSCAAIKAIGTTCTASDAKVPHSQCESNSECTGSPLACACPTGTMWTVLSGKKFCVEADVAVNNTCTTDVTTITANLAKTVPVNPTKADKVCAAGLKCVQDCQDNTQKCATPYNLAVAGEAGQLVMNIGLTISSLAMAIFLF